MKKISKLIAALLLLVCAGGLPAFAAEEAGKVFTIDSPEDFRVFSEQCRTNTWSDGLTVELNTDLDLREIELSGSVACFNGTFHGNSHTVKNLDTRYPVFQTIGENGSVRDLTVSAGIVSSRDNTAAVVSENNGLLENIRVAGQVSGKTVAGMLAAVNMPTGKILNCEVSGSLKGDNSVGGIAGKNRGLISLCVNRAHINTNVDDSRISSEDIKDILENILLTKSLNNTENLRRRIDTGGIAGYNMSGGTLEGCINEGIIGYPHNGYNTGGICGRTGGTVENCENRGTVYGRRGTGGIAGKQQPEITLDFSRDVLSAMSEEMGGINSLITDTLNTSESITESTYDRLSGLSKSMTEVKNSTNVIYNESLDRFDETADTVNSAAETLQDAAEDIAADTEGLEESFDSLDRMTRGIDASIDDLTGAFGLTEEERSEIISLNEELKQDLNTSLPFVEEVRENRLPSVPEERRARMSEGLTEINRLAGNARAMRTILDDLRSKRDRIADGSLQAEAEQRDRALGNAVGSLLDSTEQLDDSLARLSAFGTDLGGAVQDAADGIDIDLQANETVRAAGNDIYAGLDHISGQLDSMNAAAREDSLEVIGNLNEINRRFSRLTDLMKNERDRLNAIADNGGVFEDNSDTVDSASRITGCRNIEDVFGDTQTGGIVGTIGVEYDLDPEEDILRSNSRSLDYSFGVSASVSDCLNTGAVSAKDNHAGGITGKADMGSVRGNTNEGDVSSEGGYFVGGIAGYSEASLMENMARCRVSGKKNAGGICGYGGVLRGNRAAAEILDTEEYAGTIAGNVDSADAEKIADNLYYSGNYGAIDNIDYAGMAEKSAEPLEKILVKFRVCGHPLAIKEVQNGTLLRDVPCPETEEREGFYLRWDTDPDTVLTEDTVVDSAYCLLKTALSSEETAEGTDRPLVIADGQFREEDVLDFRMEGEGHYIVTVPEDGLTERKIRVLKPGSRECRLLVNGKEVQTETFGEYLVFTTGERELEILVVPGANLLYLFIGIGAAAVVLLLLLLKKRRGAAE